MADYQPLSGRRQDVHGDQDMITITAAVKRGAPRCFVVGDMPFMSYQADDVEAVRNAGRFLTEGLADAVKLEVDERYGELVGRLARAGVPVVAHIGWRPQTSSYAGVRTAVVAGRTAREAEALRETAELMEAKGAAMILIEQTPAEVADYVVKHVGIPVIGCGAGPACHGHVVVLQDALGMTERRPSFVEPVADGSDWLRTAAGRWVSMIRSGAYLKDHPYPMAEGEAEKLRR